VGFFEQFCKAKTARRTTWGLRWGSSGLIFRSFRKPAKSWLPQNEKNLEILVCAKHAETEKHLTPKSIQPESILPPLIGHCQQLI
jgi:hypothetical protein